MVTRNQQPPILSLVFGAGLSYYGFSLFRDGLGGPAILGFLFFPVLLLCLFRVLTRFPGELFADPRDRRLNTLMGQHIAAFSLGLVLGLGSAGAVARHISLGLPGETITGISGTLLDDPRLTAGGRGLGSLALENAAGRGGIRSSARGRIAVFFPDEAVSRLKEFGRGSRIHVEGALVSGTAGPGLAGGENLLFRAVSVHILQPAPALEQFRTGIRLEIVRRFSPGMAAGDSGRGWGGLALALLLGIRDNLDTGLAGLYRKAGCSHILALSGMHLAIVSSLIAFFLKRPLGLKAAAVAGAVFIFLYVFLVGSQPSLNRAALMYFLGTLAVLGALPKKPGFLLGLAFLIQITLWPESGLSISFILSYAALTGILSLGEALHGLFRGKIPELLLQPLSASAGAFLATAGVTAFFFGDLRPIGMAAGLVMVPLITLFMITSLAFLVLGLFPPLAPILGQGLSLLYGLMDRLISLAAGAPGIAVSRPLWAAGLSLGLSVFILWSGNRYGAFKRRLPSFA
jgi:competence protein ComEC